MRLPRFSCCLLVASALFPLVTAAGDPAAADPVVPLRAWMHIARGMHRETVHNILGPPSAMLSPNVWVYFDVRPANSAGEKTNVSRPAECDAMLVKFAADRADVIQFCESKPVRAFIAQQQQLRAGKTAKVAAK